MKKIQDSIMLCEDDYNILLSLLNNAYYAKLNDKRNIDDLATELKKARLVSKEDLPGDVVRLNSRIKIREAGKTKLMEMTIVTPDKADIKDRKISVMAPIGTAVIGFRKGQTIDWQVPAGKKTFTIVEVMNNLR